ncbi:MAG: CaiB/BaiF CoA-transferase family protein [Rhodococcus sp.]|uniref:CaiB/BaiF CoA transferase family protein n=1 Tax=Nocardiaceae TaxID=85025 RepID=UPI00096A3432|nr:MULTISPECIES: CaiB/BaiF CoA-transferase family protein [Rhodococcus]MCX6492582.1 CaiB/BaiF CoA-transferase family protein [Rhodococcus sp. (in: high G+C Gram-positive bacteria)]CAH0315773.1 Acetyl-CoA:oxalate CoA-transferase [Rhodococcus fascians]
MNAPLEGFTVVAIEQAVAAPLATRNLADLGARVIKIERTDGGDLARGYDHAVHGTGAHFVWLNRGKESLAIDLKSNRGRSIVHRLIENADVFVQNLAPGASERLGFGANELRATKPSLVVVNMSGFGKGGPMQDRKSYDMLIQAEAGLISITGTPDEPAKTGVPTADIATGMYCAQAVLAALLRRGRTGAGATIDISMLDSTVEWLGHAMYTQMYTGAQPPRMGVSHSSIAPYDAYPTQDGQILIGVQNDRGWQTLVTDVLGIPEMAEDLRFATNVLRVQNRAECDAVVAARTSLFTTTDLDTKLAAAGIPAAQVKQMRQVIEHPQIVERDRWRTVGTEHSTARALLPPATFADFEARMGDVPALGQHTRSLLIESGQDPDTVDTMLREGVAVQDPAFDTDLVR